jgi:glycine cleavage system H protein
VSFKEPMELGYPHLHFTAGFWWGRSDGDRVRLGITRQAAEQLTYVTHVELPAVGASFRAGEPVGVIESQKVVSDLFAPMSGTVVEHNPALGDQPFLVNSDPEGAGWLLLVDPGSPAPPRAA